MDAAAPPPPVWHSLTAGGASAVVSRLVTCAFLGTLPGAVTKMQSRYLTTLRSSLSTCASATLNHAPGPRWLLVFTLNPSMPCTLPLWACSPVADPPDTVKARLQVQGSGGAGVLYRGTADAFAKIAAREVGSLPAAACSPCQGS